MKCTIPEISWHNRDPVLSVDIQPALNNEFYRLASGGTDSHVLIWHLKILDTGATSVEAVCDLTRHQRAVNVVRWSPTGQYLASGDDDSNIIVWQQKADGLSDMIDGETQDKEKWSVFKILRGHKEDVYDICWSPNSLKLLSGSVDNTAIVWDLNKGTNENILTDHKGFVQGVCWDPQGDFLATLSSDRMCRVFNVTGKQVKCRMSKGILNLPESHPLHGQVVRYYHDDTLKSFFRRLAFSPDGNLLITPAGCLDIASENKSLYTTYIYSANSFSQPVAILPSPGQYTIAVRCCPILFELRPDAPEPAILLPYRMVIAVATRSSVILYDTQQLTPFAVISNIHYTRLTDLTWSHDGLILAVSSTDGFCSLVTFEPKELGIVYVKEEKETEPEIEVMEQEEEKVAPMEEKVEVKKEEKKRPSFLMQWAKKSSDNKTDNIMKEKDTNIILIEDSPKKDKLKDEVKKIDADVAKPIAVRRKPKEIDTIPPKSTIPSTSNINAIEVRRKPKETENINGHSSNTSVAKPIEVRKKPKDTVLSSPSTSTSSPKSSARKTKETELTPTAKPIAVRRKPQDQMDITKFLTASGPPAKKIATENKTRTSLFSSKNEDKSVLLDDTEAQDSWAKMEAEKVKKDYYLIEDSQDIKLVVEDSDFENFAQSQSQDGICSKKDLDPNEIDTKTVSSEVSDKNDTLPKNTEEKVSVSEQKSLNDIKGKITELHLQSPVNKKKVPFITLSSPKNKKNKS